MKTLCLHPLRPGTPSASSSSPLLLISSDDCSEQPLTLCLSKKGELRASPGKKLRRRTPRLGSLFYRESASGNSQWLLAPMSDRLIHNGIRPLPLAILEPGDVLACDEKSWLTSELWRPAPAAAPKNIGEKECSVCGGPLHFAPVIQCPCGRFYHLERPEDPDDPQALNCYLTAGMCGLCERKPSLDPQFLPIPPEELIPWETLESAIAAV